MAFDTAKNKHAVLSKILKIMGYNNLNELADNVAVWDTTGAPDATAHTGTQGVNLVYNRVDGTVYARTGAMTSAGPTTRAASAYYVQVC